MTDITETEFQRQVTDLAGMTKRKRMSKPDPRTGKDDWVPPDDGPQCRDCPHGLYRHFRGTYCIYCECQRFQDAPTVEQPELGL